MIATIFIVSLIGLVLTCVLAPKKNLLHAARAKFLSSARQPRWPMWASTVFMDRNGERIRRKGLFFGEAYGSSMIDVDIEDGDLVGGQDISSFSSSERQKVVKPNTIVVVDAEAAASRCKMRLRKVQAVTGEEVSFFPDRSGAVHTSRNVSEIVAVIDRKYV